MTVQTPTAPQTHAGPHLILAAAAIVAMIAIGAVLALTVGSTTKTGSAPVATSPAPTSSFSIMSLTPEQLADGALGLGYALPSAHPLPSTASVLATMSPSTRRYTQAVMALTFAKLKAGAAGAP
jgi:hypothetical protein